MKAMKRILDGIGLTCFVTFIAAGCGRIPATATRTIEVPEGGLPVLTTAERAAHEIDARRPPDLVSQASYVRPIDQPGPLKPFEQWTQQDAATDALGRIGPAAVPALIEALRSSDPAVREKALEVLARMGPEAEAAVPELIRLLDDPNPTVRKMTARTLGRIGPAAEAAVPVLMRTLLAPESSRPQ